LLGLLKDSELINYEYSKYSDAYVRRNIIKILGRSKNSSITDYIIKFLRDDNKTLRRGAVSALGELGDPRGIKAIVEHKEGEDLLWFLSDVSKLDYDKAKNAILTAYNNGEINKDNAIQVLWLTSIRNPEAHLQYLLKTMGKNFSCTSFLTFEDFEKVP
jgi:HEAT repeat protein